MSSLVLFFFTKGRNSSACNSTSHITLLHAFCLLLNFPQVHLILKIKPSLNLPSSQAIESFWLSFTIKHLKKHIYNSCQYSLTSHSCFKLFVIWLLPLPFSWSYPVNVICSILKNPLISAWSSSYYIHLWY